ncbi:MAG: hypothetical protein ISR95_04405 [Candidatus Marinimicrobia bacterium]|nr:hypothetical protein [Candidatus Neomarinimicrobiota bacterium]MBL7046852.1 hypothetical protein [Candidatus Neomarinimicrobiota bacterium]
MIKGKAIALISIILTLLIFFSGCTTIKENLSTDQTSLVKILPVEGINIKHINVRQLQEILIVSGQIHNLSRYSRKVHGHIDYAIIATDGVMLESGRSPKEIKLGKHGRGEIHHQSFQLKTSYKLRDVEQIHIRWHMGDRKSTLNNKCDNGIFG